MESEGDSRLCNIVEKRAEWLWVWFEFSFCSRSVKRLVMIIVRLCGWDRIIMLIGGGSFRVVLDEVSCCRYILRVSCWNVTRTHGSSSLYMIREPISICMIITRNNDCTRKYNYTHTYTWENSFQCRINFSHNVSLALVHHQFNKAASNHLFERNNARSS